MELKLLSSKFLPLHQTLGKVPKKKKKNQAQREVHWPSKKINKAALRIPNFFPQECNEHLPYLHLPTGGKDTPTSQKAGKLSVCFSIQPI